MSPDSVQGSNKTQACPAQRRISISVRSQVTYLLAGRTSVPPPVSFSARAETERCILGSDVDELTVN